MTTFKMSGIIGTTATSSNLHISFEGGKARGQYRTSLYELYE